MFPPPERFYVFSISKAFMKSKKNPLEVQGLITD